MIRKTDGVISSRVNPRISENDKEIIQYAIRAFGFVLLKENGTYTFNKFAERIKRNYDVNNKRIGVIVRVLERKVLWQEVI